MKNITIEKPTNDSLPAQLLSLYNAFKNVKDGEDLEFDLNKLVWVSPLLVLPISAYISSTNSRCNLDNCSVKDYLNIINFPKGIESVSALELAIQINKNYIPVGKLRKDLGIDRQRLESMFSKMIFKVVDTSAEGARSAIYYPIEELVGNIFEHSKKEEGFIFGQYYPKKEYLDICIVDRGRGLKGSYKEEQKIDLTDEEAINRVMSGHSVKSDVERGYGVRTSKRVVCEGLGGSFILLSGSMALISSQNKDKIVELPGFYWQGVIVAYRIPKPIKSIDISKYVE
ncbi:MAG: hypothetical protein Q8P32_02755 [Candidatus Komeilibacteria bacterium]|nr:hypothetical protein [Candidatus Komeilibacteria bacterium]